MTTSASVAYCQHCHRSTAQTETGQERGGQVWVDRRCNVCGQFTGRRREPPPGAK